MKQKRGIMCVALDQMCRQTTVSTRCKCKCNWFGAFHTRKPWLLFYKKQCKVIRFSNLLRRTHLTLDTCKITGGPR